MVRVACQESPGVYQAPDHGVWTGIRAVPRDLTRPDSTLGVKIGNGLTSGKACSIPLQHISRCQLRPCSAKPTSLKEGLSVSGLP